ncbi:DDE-type integrase/transposase/recombinase [Erwinia psidii]|uniref:DDE domain-containing protein n=1 Tax=Erwinia psidii TaxID=69224 RepID=A0A3N6S1K8_9GAMM|nr:DDE domain-containing protein [Erwinia psidii]
MVDLRVHQALTPDRGFTLLSREDRCPSGVAHRLIKYRNNVTESDHGQMKRLISASSGFQSMNTAYATIKDKVFK